MAEERFLQPEVLGYGLGSAVPFHRHCGVHFIGQALHMARPSDVIALHMRTSKCEPFGLEFGLYTLPHPLKMASSIP